MSSVADHRDDSSGSASSSSSPSSPTPARTPASCSRTARSPSTVRTRPGAAVSCAGRRRRGRPPDGEEARSPDRSARRPDAAADDRPDRRRRARPPAPATGRSRAPAPPARAGRPAAAARRAPGTGRRTARPPRRRRPGRTTACTVPSRVSHRAPVDLAQRGGDRCRRPAPRAPPGAALTDVERVVIRARPRAASQVNATGTTCGTPFGRTVLNVARCRSVTNASCAGLSTTRVPARSAPGREPVTRRGGDAAHELRQLGPSSALRSPNSAGDRSTRRLVVEPHDGRASRAGEPEVDLGDAGVRGQHLAQPLDDRRVQRATGRVTSDRRVGRRRHVRQRHLHGLQLHRLVAPPDPAPDHDDRVLGQRRGVGQVGLAEEHDLDGALHVLDR